MKALTWIKEHAAVTASLALNIGLVSAVVWQAHVIQHQRELIMQMYFLLKMLTSQVQ